MQMTPQNAQALLEHGLHQFRRGPDDRILMDLPSWAPPALVQEAHDAMIAEGAPWHEQSQNGGVDFDWCITPEQVDGMREMDPQTANEVTSRALAWCNRRHKVELPLDVLAGFREAVEQEQLEEQERVSAFDQSLVGEKLDGPLAQIILGLATLKPFMVEGVDGEAEELDPGRIVVFAKHHPEVAHKFLRAMAKGMMQSMQPVMEHGMVAHATELNAMLGPDMDSLMGMAEQALRTIFEGCDCDACRAERAESDGEDGALD